MSLGNGLELKFFEGQPWSAWTEFLGTDSPPEIPDVNEVHSEKKESSGTMRLKKSDMGIYGQYPGAEPFELAICEFCGDKFKLAALAEHIGLRHQDGKKIPTVDITSVALTSKAKLLQLHLQKKGKPRHSRHGKETEKHIPVTDSNTKLKPKAPDDKGKGLENSTKSDDVKTSLQGSLSSSKTEKSESSSLTSILKQVPPKVKQLKIKLKKPKEQNYLSTKLVGTKILKNNVWTNSPASSTVGKVKEKSKNENGLKKSNSKLVAVPQIQSQSQTEQSKSSEDISKMQPVVQLSPLDYPQGSVKVQSGNQESKKKVKSERKIVSIKDRTYNPDRHCGVVGKENTKPCTRSLTCKSHSMSLRRAVRGRSKAFDILLADHRAEKEKEIFKRKIMGCRSHGESVLSPKTNHPTQNGVVLAANPKDESSEVQKIKNRSGRNITSEHSRLSLPVSIKNPNNLFSQFQNSNDERSKALISNYGKLLGTSSILKKQIINPLLARQDNGAVLKNAQHLQIQSPPRQLAPKPSPIQVEIFRQWQPGFRKCGGLLYSNSNIPRVNGARIIAPKLENTCNIIDPSKTIASLEISATQSKTPLPTMQVETPLQQETIKRIPLTLGPGKKKAVATLIPKQATSLLMPININGKSLLNNQQQKLATVVQVSSPSHNGLIYAQNQSCKRKSEEPISSSKLKKEPKLDLIAPILSKSFSGNRSLMRVSIANGILEKNVIVNSPLPFAGSRQFQSGISILQNNGIRISPPQRVHYVTSSGPLPVTLQQLPLFSQMQLKPLEVKAQPTHKLKVITPNGMVFIQKDQCQ